MSDRVPPGCVWLLNRGPVTSWIQMMRVAPIPHNIGESTARTWSYNEHYDCTKDFALHVFGDLPEPNEARLVDRARREWWCEMCGEWIIESDLRICDGVLYHHPCQEDVTKSRAHVVETIPLEVAN